MTRSFKLYHGDCFEVLKTLPDNSIDAIVTDPPYGLGKQPDALAMLRDWLTTGHYEVKGSGFMDKEWDAFVPQPRMWREALRVLKPGGHILAFAGTRTQDLMALGLRIAGFEIRDMIAWVYGSGFPKSLDVSKAIDKAAGAEREVVGIDPRYVGMSDKAKRAFGELGHQASPTGFSGDPSIITAPATDAAREWQGWGTALKPALEPVTLARKPLAGTVAANVLEHGTGAINVDGCRVGDSGGTTGSNYAKSGLFRLGGKCDIAQIDAGRWPANLIHDGSAEVVRFFPENAARFFYSPKADGTDRDSGLYDAQGLSGGAATGRKEGSAGLESPRAGAGRKGGNRNVHPTVKPVHLMRYLCRLVTPPGGIVLDPFMGSGSTGKAALMEGFRFIGIELEAEYFAIATERIESAERQTKIRNAMKKGKP